MNNNFSNKENKHFDKKNLSYINNLYQNNNNCNISNNLLKNSNYYSFVNSNINNFVNNSQKYNIGNDNSFVSNKNNDILINIINPNINKFNNYNIYNHNDPSLNNRGNYNNYMASINDKTIPYFNNNDHSHLLSHNYYNHINIEDGINNINLNSNINNNNMINLRRDNNIQNLPIYNTNNNAHNNNYSKLIKNNNTLKKNKLNNKNDNKVKKEKKNINDNKVKKENKNINDNIYLDEFLQYINSLPMPLVNFLCTSKGIIEIQRKLPKSNYDYKMFLTLHLNKDGLSKIMKNTYGNYFFQQLIKNSEEQFISLIISYISENFINISKDSSGTFSLQALLDEISTLEEEQKILNCIKNHEMEMAYDKNATHVLKKLILLFPDIHRIELNKIILDNLKDLCLHSNGICLIKNFIRSNTIINDKKRINNGIINNFVTIAESPFGNYGIQYLIENWDKDMLIDIRGKIMENLYKLSMQQFSSNVVEKAIEIFEEEYKEKIIKKLCFEDNFIILLKSKFGRFVLYKAINYMKIDIKRELENKLINNLNNNIYNNKDKNKVKSFLLKIQYKKTENDYSLINNKYLSQNNTSINNSKEDKSNNEF